MLQLKMVNYSTFSGVVKSQFTLLSVLFQWGRSNMEKWKFLISAILTWQSILISPESMGINVPQLKMVNYRAFPRVVKSMFTLLSVLFHMG